VVFEGLYWMQGWAYATSGRGANLLTALMLADSSEGEWLSPLHRETGRPRQR